VDSGVEILHCTVLYCTVTLDNLLYRFCSLQRRWHHVDSGVEFLRCYPQPQPLAWKQLPTLAGAPTGALEGGPAEAPEPSKGTGGTPEKASEGLESPTGTGGTAENAASAADVPNGKGETPEEGVSGADGPPGTGGGESVQAEGASGRGAQGASRGCTVGSPQGHLRLREGLPLCHLRGAIPQRGQVVYQQRSGERQGGGAAPLWEEAARGWGAVGPSLDGWRVA